jgi:hypothetical protein
MRGALPETDLLTRLFGTTSAELSLSSTFPAELFSLQYSHCKLRICAPQVRLQPRGLRVCLVTAAPHLQPSAAEACNSLKARLALLHPF